MYVCIYIYIHIYTHVYTHYAICFRNINSNDNNNATTTITTTTTTTAAATTTTTTTAAAAASTTTVDFRDGDGHVHHRHVHHREAQNDDVEDGPHKVHARQADRSEEAPDVSLLSFCRNVSFFMHLMFLAYYVYVLACLMFSYGQFS